MSIDFNMIKSEVENLARELNRHRDNDLSHNDMIAVSDLLAETVYMIRKKYGITTMYYLASEIKAADGVGPAGKDNNVEAEWKEDALSLWDGNNGFTCSSCGHLDTVSSPFCPNCGRRMKV